MEFIKSERKILVAARKQSPNETRNRVIAAGVCIVLIAIGCVLISSSAVADLLHGRGDATETSKTVSFVLVLLGFAITQAAYAIFRGNALSLVRKLIQSGDQTARS